MIDHAFLLPFPPPPSVYISHHAMHFFDLPLMKALDWAETFGNFVTIDICPSIYSASEVLNSQSNYTKYIIEIAFQKQRKLPFNPPWMKLQNGGHSFAHLVWAITLNINAYVLQIVSDVHDPAVSTTPFTLNCPTSAVNQPVDIYQ